MNDAKLDFLLDLFQSGYKNAYVSVMDYMSDANDPYSRIEIVLPNVGRLWLQQSFDESLDEQIPHIDVYYITASNPKSENKITNSSLINRAINIIYKSKAYFEQHPEYCVTDTDLIRRAQKNQNFLKKQYAKITKRHYGFLQTFFKEK